jgi:demethylmenaquinone methyltransferase/2-methoxy-6-polyprenyl-1,4-benzoquinol methylase
MNMHDSFGYEKVTPEERKRRISHVFASVAARYDLMNDLMSFGIHRLWKRTMVRFVKAAPDAVIVDLAGGTGDVARAIFNKTGIRPVVADASHEMMVVGRNRDDVQLGWIAAEGELLPFGDNTLDLVTLSFGLRNMTDTDVALKEIERCLKPGGRLICLEFSKPYFWLKPFYDFYSWAIIPRLGAWVSGEPAAYQYLIESIRKFPDQHELCAAFSQAGFSEVHYQNLSFGISALHFGTKGVAMEVTPDRK